jgi:hypothetical protein
MAMYCSWLVSNNKVILCVVIAIYCTSFVATQNVNFYYDNFENSNLTQLDDAAIYSVYLQLNKEDTFSVGRILHPEKVQFQDVKSMTFASFSTFFTFSVNSSSKTNFGDGLAFIIVANNTSPPGNFSGGALGILSNETNGNASNHVFAVEIDTFPNSIYNDPNVSHVGVDINSVNSTHTYNFCNQICNQSYFANQGIFGAWIDYSATNETLSVAVQPWYGTASTPPPSQILVPNFTLLDVLEDDGQMYVGFSGATGADFEYHYIYNWSFSTRGLPNQISPSPSPNQISPSASPNQISPSGSPNQISPSPSPNQISPSASPNQISPSGLRISRSTLQISQMQISPSGVISPIGVISLSPSGVISPSGVSPSGVWGNLA